MIFNQWYAVLESRELPQRRTLSALRLGQRLVFWRDGQGAVGCIAERCVHRGASLGLGRVRDGCVECPFHGLRFDTRGRCTLIPADGKAATPDPRFNTRSLPVHEAHGLIWVWWGDDRDPLPEPRYFDDIDGTFSQAGFRAHWRTHYSRAIENQLDVAHLPFVHRSTIGRGGNTLVDGPLTRWVADEHLQVQVFNRPDDGSEPRRPDELEPDEDRVRVELLLPNLWQNRISPRLRIIAAFAPVDDDNTVIYLRVHHRLVPIPGLGWLVARLFNPLNRVILAQDQRVVETQRPRISSLRGCEQLLRADGPIVAYRKRRHELQKFAPVPAPQRR